MYVLLPPSEAKTAGGRGRPLGQRAETGPLAGARTQVRDALTQLLAGDPARAAQALLLPPGVARDALAANAAVLRSPTRAALNRYAGVVYDGLDFASLPPEAQRVARRSVLIFSGLLGVVSGAEAVPDYRVPAKAGLPGLGIVGTFWRPILDGVLAARLARGLIVDLRSSDYAAMWRPDARTATRTVSVRVLSRTPAGGYGVISYPSKYGKGLLAAELLRRAGRGEAVGTIADVASAWRASGGGEAVPTAAGHLDLYPA